MSNITMSSQDAVSASLGNCFIEMKDRRYKLMSAINIEAKMEKNKAEIPILGKTGKKNKSTGWTGTGSATFYYNTSLFREVMQEYKNSGKDIYFDMVIENSDASTSVGRQIIILKNCNIDNIVLAKLDADGEYLDEEFDFTFDDWELKEKFNMLLGMEQ